MSANGAILSISNIEVIYDHVILVLRGVSLEVQEGQIVALLGANGAGKTTTLKAISNLLRAERGDVTKGQILYRGDRIDQLNPSALVKRGICQVMEGRHCFQHLTVEENLLTGAYTRGIVAGIVTTEGIRKAQERFGKGKPMTGEQIRWGLENLNIDDKRMKDIGATGLMQALKVSCMDLEGGGAVKFQQWDGNHWKVITDWIQPDKELVRGMVEESAAAYAKEKKITLRDCGKES